jgi:hypothetical protein
MGEPGGGYNPHAYFWSGLHDALLSVSSTQIGRRLRGVRPHALSHMRWCQRIFRMSENRTSSLSDDRALKIGEPASLAQPCSVNRGQTCLHNDCRSCQLFHLAGRKPSWRCECRCIASPNGGYAVTVGRDPIHGIALLSTADQERQTMAALEAEIPCHRLLVAQSYIEPRSTHSHQQEAGGTR